MKQLSLIIKQKTVNNIIMSQALLWAYHIISFKIHNDNEAGMVPVFYKRHCGLAFKSLTQITQVGNKPGPGRNVTNGLQRQMWFRCARREITNEKVRLVQTGICKARPQVLLSHTSFKLWTSPKISCPKTKTDFVPYLPGAMCSEEF